jgi:hypothetical protein
MRAAVRAHFDLELSIDSVGLKLAAMYEDVLGRKRDTVAATRRSEERGAIRTS